MVSLKSEQGAILIVVMIFSTVMSMLTLLSMQNTWLAAKMTQAFSHSIQRRLQQEQTMFSLEELFKVDPTEFIKSGQAHLLQFVPDTIHFAERAGLYYYELRADSIVTTQVIYQDPKDEEAQWVKFSNGVICRLNIVYLHGENHLILSTADGAVEHSLVLPLHVTSILLTDRHLQGWVDAIYIGDRSGNIWQLDTKPIQYNQWRWQKLNQVEGQVKEVFATTLSTFKSPILIVRSTNQGIETDQLFGLVGSDMIWTQSIPKDTKLKLHRYWVQIEAYRLDVTSGTMTFASHVEGMKRLNWRELSF